MFSMPPVFAHSIVLVFYFLCEWVLQSRNIGVEVVDGEIPVTFPVMSGFSYQFAVAGVQNGVIGPYSTPTSAVVATENYIQPVSPTASCGLAVDSSAGMLYQFGGDSTGEFAQSPLLWGFNLTSCSL